jgi:hypothetical protein
LIIRCVQVRRASPFQFELFKKKISRPGTERLAKSVEANASNAEQLGRGPPEARTEEIGIHNFHFSPPFRRRRQGE